MTELSLDEYQARAQQTAIYPGQGSFLGLLYVNSKLQGEAGEFSEHVGKALRDDGIASLTDTGVTFHFLSPERREAMIGELGDLLWYAAAAARELHIPLSKVAEFNLNKLARRQALGKLQGSGSDR